MQSFETDITRIPSPLKDVDIWRATLEVDSRKIAQLADSNTCECDHESSLRNTLHKGYERFAATSALLRTVLAGYMRTLPSDIEFQYGISGKPRLADGSTDAGITFSLADSGRTLLIAVTREKQIGVDIERLSFGRDLDNLGRESLTYRERDRWANTMRSCRRKFFYRLWVRKEAYLKATGSELKFPMNRVDVLHTSYRSNQSVTVPIVDGQPVPWTIYDLELPGGAGTTVAALAIEGVPAKRRLNTEKRRHKPTMELECCAESSTV
jgi:4'-phosphopantetheinyl transferase